MSDSKEDKKDEKDEKKDEKKGDEKDEKENNKPEEKKDEEKLVIMKKGDYNVHILIEDVKNLIEIKENSPPVPRVKMTVFGKSQYTTKMKKPCSDFSFNEHFYFDKTNLTAEMLDSEKVVLEVYDNKNTNRKDYFGIYELDFGYVYNQESHVLNNIWIGLANPESEDISKIRGYLKLSISVLHESDMRVELEPKENELSNCLIPAQINMKYKQISFFFYRAEELPDMDSIFTVKKTGRRCDGYIEVKYMGIVRKTSVVEMQNEMVVWNQIVDIPATKPAVSQKICMVVKDEDVDGDDVAGSLEININDIYNGKYEKLQYINIYGSPINKSGGIYDQMNYNAEIGSHWNGRILMRCEVTDVDSPIARVRDIEKNDYENIYKQSRTQTWSIWVRIISTYFLPSDKEYAIKVCIQEKTVITQYKKAVNGCIDFCESLKLLLNTFSDDEFVLPDIFIYLVDKKESIEKQNVCFQRIKADYFYLKKDIMVIKLLPDPAVGIVKNMSNSGLLKCKICVFNTAKNKQGIPSEREWESGGEPPELPMLGMGSKKPASKPIVVDNDEDDLEGLLNKNSKPIEEEPPQTLVPKEGCKTYTIIAIVYMSKGLIAAEKSGTSDPFVKLTYKGVTKQTSVKNNTANGIWNEKLVFDSVLMDFQDQSTWPIFLLSVLDYNKIKSDVPLGYNYVWLCNANYTLDDTALRPPKWHNLFLPKSNKQQGQILMSFYIFDQSKSDYVTKMNNINYVPETSLYSCEISILGLRQLKPLGMIPVKKPFIKFDLNSLNVTGKPEDAHANIQTIPVSGGTDPTINTVIKFDAKLPSDRKFMPELQCEVYDHMLGGLHNSLLGIFSLDLRRIIKKTKAQIDEDMRETRKDLGLHATNQLLLQQFSSLLPAGGLAGVNIGMGENQPELQSNNVISTATQETAPEQNKPLETSNNNNEQLLQISKNVNEGKKDDDEGSEGSGEHFIEDEDKVELTQENINIDKLQMDNVEIVVPGGKGKRLSLKDSVRLGGDFLKKNLHDSQYFVIFPNLKSFKIPGYGTVKKTQKDSSGKEVELSDNNEGDKVQKEFLMEDLSKVPDKRLYFQIGYLLKAPENIKPEESTKHYRRIYGCQLEYMDEADWKIKSPFNVGKIRRGKYIDKKSETGLFDAMRDINGKVLHTYNGEMSNANPDQSISGESGLSNVGFAVQKDDEKSYGKFKGIIRIAEKSQMEEYERVVEQNKQGGKFGGETLRNYNKYETLRKKLLNKNEIIIRIYVLELNDLASKDIGSESDPYVKILINNKVVIDDRKNYQEDQKNCKWYKYYDIPGTIPGSSTLKLEVWDYDTILPDDLIGYTTIDLEDRFYNDDWQSLKHKPVEVRPLINPDITGAQGKVYMWLEMFDVSEKNNNPVWKIEPEPITEYEVRFIVWETEDMEMMDVEGTSDIYCIGYIDQKDLQKTDIHWRCQTGAASFNWRMLLPLKLPIQKPVITLQVYDKDVFASDDFISGATFDMKNLVNIPKLLDIPLSFNREYFSGLSKEEKAEYKGIEFLPKEDDPEGIKFWIQCYKGKKSADAEGAKGGRVMCSLEILPKALAEQEKVGKGRDEPNCNPYLPPPVGRIEFSLNPFKMLNQLVGPKFRRKCYCYCICCLLLVYLGVSLPNIFTAIVT